MSQAARGEIGGEFVRPFVWWTAMALGAAPEPPPLAAPDREVAALRREIARKGWIIYSYSAMTERGEPHLICARPNRADRCRSSRQMSRCPQDGSRSWPGCCGGP